MPAAALCIALLAIFLLHWGSTSQITPEIPTEDTASVIAVHKPPNIPTPEIRVFQSKPIQVEETVWSGLRDGQTTTFYCDMDGNGEEETYVFALDYLNSPHEYVVYYDRCECLSGQVMERTVFPFIWLLHNDGTMTPAEEFQKYLEDVQITIWKTQENQPLSIEAYTAEYAWPGAARIQFYIEESAVWVCQYTATLSGQTLTASADFIYQVERLSIETTP